LHEVQSDSIDLTEAIADVRERISGKTLNEALLVLATIVQPTDFGKATAQATSLMKRFPLQNLIGGAKLESDGRVVAHRTPAIGGDDQSSKRAVWERVVEHVVMSYQIDVQAGILPALNQLTFEHAVTLQDLEKIVVNNQFIPPGHEMIFVKGFLAGFRWNFPVALSLLVPQLENSLRYLLERAGHEVTKRDKHGLQSVIQLGTIITDQALPNPPEICPTTANSGHTAGNNYYRTQKSVGTDSGRRYC